MKKFLLGILLAGGALFCSKVQAQHSIVNAPLGSYNFGKNITILTNGNYVVADPRWHSGTAGNVGAVYLYDGITHVLISTLTGNLQEDRVGNGGITSLSNGNFVISSPTWNGTFSLQRGAVTWVNGTTGLSGVVSASNSLVGSNGGEKVGSGGVMPLPNGNYVIRSLGGTTWANGNTGITGFITASNSLMAGSVNTGAITVLPNSNYLVKSTWNNGATSLVGAVTWCNGATGLTGAISPANSLVGSYANDIIGHGYSSLLFDSDFIKVLPNNNYVVISPHWNANRGAVTFCNGTTGTTGFVTAANSVVGSTANDYLGNGGITILSNGNYVISSPLWDNVFSCCNNSRAGAVTWGSKNTGVTGIVSPNNSLVGGFSNDSAGSGGVIALSNGNYIINSPGWLHNSSFATSPTRGAVTWGNGTSGVTGIISDTNSLIGSHWGDGVGRGGIVPLTNGSYVISSPFWRNNNFVEAGAATWGNGIAGVTGIINAFNSLVGTATNAHISIGGITALTNGNYVVNSYDANAVTWGNGTTGIFGNVSAANSLMGPAAGASGVTALTNGNYVVCSPAWSDGTKSTMGAATWGDGITGISGAISGLNSLIGDKDYDRVGLGGAVALTNGNYVVNSYWWGKGMTSSGQATGAVTWGNGLSGITGKVSPINSLTGNISGDAVGHYGVVPLTNGAYVIKSPEWSNGSLKYAGAATWGHGTAGITGVISASNSIVGTSTNDFVGGETISGFGEIIVIPNGGYVLEYIKNSNISYEKGVATFTLTGFPIIGTAKDCNSVFANNTEQIYSLYDSIGKRLFLGIEGSKLYIVKEMLASLAVNTTSLSQEITSIGVLHFIDDSCQLITTIAPADTNFMSGPVVAKVYLQNSTPQINNTAYVRRHYQTTASQDEESTRGRLTLYFRQAEFDDYNANNGADPDLPVSSADINGIANLKATQQRGNSSTGLPGSFITSTTPANILIDPVDSNIIWNASQNRWEVTFTTMGFGGFFIHGSTNNDPLSTNSFVAETTGSTGASLFPNPAQTVINLQLEDRALLGTSASILNIQGSVLQTISLKSSLQPIAIERLPAGFYFLKLANGEVLKFAKY